MLRLHEKPRDLEKWKKALNGSYAVVYARLIANRKLVGFARATSDRALNGTIWDVITDPALPDEVRVTVEHNYQLREHCRTQVRSA